MALSIYEGRRRQGNWPIALMAINLLFAGGCIFLWSVMAFIVADAMTWATWGFLGHSRPDFFDYPFLLLWALPLGGNCAAWLLRKADKEKLAVTAAMFPLFLLSTVVLWYNVMPPEWR